MLVIIYMGCRRYPDEQYTVNTQRPNKAANPRRAIAKQQPLPGYLPNSRHRLVEDQLEETSI